MVGTVSARAEAGFRSHIYLLYMLHNLWRIMQGSIFVAVLTKLIFVWSLQEELTVFVNRYNRDSNQSFGFFSLLQIHPGGLVDSDISSSPRSLDNYCHGSPLPTTMTNFSSDGPLVSSCTALLVGLIGRLITTVSQRNCSLNCSAQ